MPTGKIAAFLVAMVLVVGQSAAGARRPDEWPTNLDLLRAALAEATEKLLAAAPDSFDRVAVSVKPDTGSMSRRQFVRAAVQEALLVRRVVVLADSTDAALLEVTVRRLSVSVPATHRRWLVGRRMAHREAKVALAATLRTRAGLTVWATDAEANADDWVPVSALAWAEGPAALGLAPMVGQEFWVRIAEPILVMSSVGAVIYLFFTQ